MFAKRFGLFRSGLALYSAHQAARGCKTHMLHKVMGFLTNKQEIHSGRKLVYGEISRLVADNTEEWLLCTPEWSETKLSICEFLSGCSLFRQLLPAPRPPSAPTSTHKALCTFIVFSPFLTKSFLPVRI